MSFDLYVYIDDSIDGSFNLWQECLENVGLVCKLPEHNKISNISHEHSIRCQLLPPLTARGICVDDCEFFIDVMSVDKEMMNDLIENTEDEVLIQRLKNSKYWVTINTSEEDDLVAAQIVNFVSATLAYAYNGVLFDPQEFGCVYDAKVYEVARYYCEVDKINLPVQEPPQVTTPKNPSPSNKSFFGFITALIKPKPMFSPYVISVKKAWRDNAKDKFSAQFNIRSKEGIKHVQKLLDDNSRKPNPSFVLSKLLYLNLFDVNKKHSEWYLLSLNKIGNRVYKTTAYEDTTHNKDHPIMVAYSAIDRLNCYLSLACAKTILTPALPDKKILMEGILDIDEKLKNCKGGFDDITHRSSLLCGVLLLIVGETDFSLKFITRHKTLIEKKHQAQMLINLGKEISEFGHGNLSQIVEGEFFAIFNAYRLPVYSQTVKAMKNEHLLISDSIGNYLFSWLYLVAFRNQQQTTWKELKKIMTS